LLAGLASYLRDGCLPYRLRLIGVLCQLALQPLQLLIELRAISVETLPVDTATAPVGPDPLPG
jgi:hypothetical protein